MSFTNTANSTIMITVCYIVIAVTKKNNANLLLLVGNTMTNSIVSNRLCTNYNTDACPSDYGFALGSWYMRCNLTNALSTLLSVSLTRSLLASRLVNC